MDHQNYLHKYKLVHLEQDIPRQYVMKILVLTFEILLILSFAASETNTNSTSIPETYNLINPIGDLPIAKPGCNSRCGDLIVPYPFGIGLDSNCSIGKGFDIYCNTSSKPHKAFYRIYDEYILIKKNISDSTLRISNKVASKCYDQNLTTLSDIRMQYDFSEQPYTFSQVNRFIVIGCNDYAWLTAGITNSSYVYTGCMSLCYEDDYDWKNILGDACSGNGCCQSPIPREIKYYYTRVQRNQNEKEPSGLIHGCTYAFVGEQDTFRYNRSMNYSFDHSFTKKVEDNVPVVLDWAIGNLSCAEAKATQGYACQSNSICVDSISGGYRCQCKEGRYEGNPYLSPGCQDIDECKDLTKYPCYGVCINTPGNYTCKCKKGYSGDATVPNGCKKKPFYQTLLFSLGLGLGLPTIATGLLLLYFIAQKRKLEKLKKEYYEQNGGALLKDKLQTKGGVGLNSVNIFRIEELKEATDNFANSKVIGKGGNGIVYQGTLKDKRFVAIKKSQKVDEGQREEFINEMVILTQINHTNVVQLIGFCLETEVPLLAYELVSNNTLHYHIHNIKNGTRRLSWDTRLRIAHESAGALSYLHTDARMSVIHRDVKSTNILLDEKFTAKIADFGASRLVPLGHDEVVTLVQGTFGYLDPEYFHTGQLTDRSDVYSFGVVLAELLTGQQPLNNERCLQERNLATYFLKRVEENNFLDILEKGVVKEAVYEQLKAISDLVCRCLNQVGVKRPSMKEVTMELDALRKLGTHTYWVNEDNYNEMSSMTEKEPIDFYTIPLIPKSDTFEDSSISSITSEMQDMMLSSRSAR